MEGEDVCTIVGKLHEERVITFCSQPEGNWDPGTGHPHHDTGSFQNKCKPKNTGHQPELLQELSIAGP